MEIRNLLQDRTAIVTGGTRGIGLAVVRTFLASGAKVVLLGSRRETVEKTLEQLRGENPEWPVWGQWPDLTDFAAVKAAFEEARKTLGRLDILANNAGISARESLYEYDPQAFQKILALNVDAVFNCSKAAAELMKPQGGGCIINTSSMVSLYGQRSGCGYPTSKFAVNGLTKSLARELGPDGIRVNAVAPGVIRTDMVAALPADMVQRLTSTIPLGRVGEPQDIANAYLYLASDLASYVTGAILSVDGATIS
jgi:3-oxoacyl-[acyl-carrier protein] reductase/7-alpha-hydroxysteroid dehydrogenase